jgi:predicted metal-dependent enzyme (double-stranded beta helix superfamily)
MDQAPQTWLLREDGHCVKLPLQEVALPPQTYRLYRFLTELEDILETVPEDFSRIQQIIPRVRQLLISSYWLQLTYTEPSPDPGWSVHCLYDEVEFPLTVQMEAWLPGKISPIHNHGTWGIVAIVSGQEQHQFWRRSPISEKPDRLEYVGEKLLGAGDVIAFTPGAIHCIQPLGAEPAVTFNLYGPTDFSQRFEFDRLSDTASPF